MRRRALPLLVLVAALALVIMITAAFAPRAYAQDSRRAGTVRLTTLTGGHGPVDLRPSREGLSGELEIVNEGKEPLVVSRIAVRGDAADPRSPPKVSARIAEGVLPVTIQPGAQKRAIVTWTPERGVRLRQLFGHVVVTTSDEQSGDVAMGVRAQNGGFLGPLERHVLSLLVGAPLLGAIVTLVLRTLGRRDDKTPRLVATIALGVQAALAIYVYRGFLPDVSRVDGNDGLQFVEHGVFIRAISSELFFGVDGTSAVTILVSCLVGFFALLPERPVTRDSTGYHATYLLLAAAVPGTLSAMDGLVFVLFAAASVASASLLVGGWGGEGRREAATKLALLGSIAILFLFLVVVVVGRNADPTFLVDGTKTSTTFNMAELARVAFGAKEAKLFGVALVKMAFVLVLVASVILLGSFPLHGWLAPTILVAPTSSGALIAAALPSIGVCALLRLGCAVLPEGMRWASGVVVALGAVSAAYGALGALGQNDLRRMAACASTSQIGFVLLGAGSLTPQGLSGAMVLASTRALAVALFVILIGAAEERARTRDVEKLAGVASQMPGWATALAAAALAQAGVLGLGGAWGPMLALLGALPNYPPLALLASGALVVTAAAHFHALSRVVFGKLLPDWERSPLLEPFGGRFPDLTAREWTTIAPLATLVVVLGVWPAPVFATTTGTVRDLTNAVSPPGADQIAWAPVEPAGRLASR